MMAAQIFSAPVSDRYLEDYKVGARFEFGPIDVEEAEIIAFSERFDPQTMHTDPVKAKKGRYAGLIASGWHTLALMMRLFVDNYLSSIASHASPGVNEVRWLHPVRPGDRLFLRVGVLDVRSSRSKPDRGVIVSFVEGVNQDGTVVCSFEAINLMQKRHP